VRSLARGIAQAQLEILRRSAEKFAAKAAKQVAAGEVNDSEPLAAAASSASKKFRPVTVLLLRAEEVL